MVGFENIRTAGELRLVSARLGGDVHFTGAQILSAGLATPFNQTSLNLSRATIAGDLFLRALSAQGDVLLEEARIGGALILLPNTGRTVRLDLTNATADSLVDDPQRWPAPGHLYLEGFTYKRIGKGPKDAPNRLVWLSLDHSKGSQRYRQLSKILKESGDFEGARMVLERMEALQRTSANVPERLWNALLETTIGYGYYPERAVWELLGLTALGWILYRRSYLAGGITPTDKEAYQCKKESGSIPDHYRRFAPLLYSLENCFPLIKLGQTERWQPDPQLRPSRTKKVAVENSRPNGSVGLRRIFGDGSNLRRLLGGADAYLASPRFIRAFLWVQVLLGWLLATLFVAGIAGMLHKD